MDSSGGLIGILVWVGAAGLYICGLSCDSTVEALKTVTRVRKLKDLAPLLDAAAKELPLLVEVLGKVGSETPMNCEYSNLKGVILEKEQRNHFLKCNDKGEWKEYSTRLSSKSTTVPWYLDDSTGRVKVPRTHGALSLDKMVRNSVFEKAEKSQDGEEVEEQGLQVLGVKKIETVLPIGTPLTVIGEAVVDQTDGTIQIRKPREGPFYLSGRTVPQIIKDKQIDSSVCKYVAVGLAVGGIYFLAESAYRYIVQRYRHREIRRSRTSWARRISGTAENGTARSRRAAVAEQAVQEGSSGTAENGSARNLRAAVAEQAVQEGLSGTAENGSARSRRAALAEQAVQEGLSGTADNKSGETDQELCVICFERDYNSVFVPCGHMGCCVTCALDLNLCPECRAPINQVVRTFRP